MLSNPEQVARRLAAVGARRGHTPPALSHTHKHTHERSTNVTHIQSLCTVCFLYHLRVEETYRNTPASVTLYLVPTNTSTHTHTHTPHWMFFKGWETSVGKHVPAFPVEPSLATSCLCRENRHAHLQELSWRPEQVSRVRAGQGVRHLSANCASFLLYCHSVPLCWDDFYWYQQDLFFYLSNEVCLKRFV